MIRPRWLAQLWAYLRGYFWLPCPVCGEMFAGFEWGRYSLYGPREFGAAVCSKAACQAYARETYAGRIPPRFDSGSLRAWRLK